MSSTANSINNQIGSSVNNTIAQHIRASSGQWDRFNDQTDVHGYYSGVGSPEGVVAADIGSIYSDTGAGSTGIYYKTTDTVMTGWANLSAGSIAQMNETTSNTASTTLAIIPIDNTIPQITEGTQYMTHVFTPTSASSLLRIEFFSYITLVSSCNCTVAIFDGSTDALIASDFGGDQVAFTTAHNGYISTTVVAGTTSPITFSIRFGTNSVNSVTMNPALYGAAGLATLRITEYTPAGSIVIPNAFSVVAQTFTANGTYTPTVGMQYCQVEVMGGGGGGGGTPATGAAIGAAGGGGGGGEYAYGVFSAATIGVSQAVTVGAAGAGVVGGTGGTGGATSLGALISANGGIGALLAVSGAGTVVGFGALGGSGGAGGSFRVQGGAGGQAKGNQTLFITPSFGGASYFGVGGNQVLVGTGNAGLGFGGAGSGAFASGVTAAQAGGSGTSGLIKITEYVIV